MAAMADCIFCRIASGEAETDRIYEDDQVVAFRDLNPQAPHHVLIIPREHIATTLDLDESHRELLGHIHLVAAKLARDLGFADEGFRLVLNTNRGAGQSVWHLHYHLLGGRPFGWPPG
jgi:histidine triad (HIT) family protein